MSHIAGGRSRVGPMFTHWILVQYRFINKLNLFSQWAVIHTSNDTAIWLLRGARLNIAPVACARADREETCLTWQRLGKTWIPPRPTDQENGCLNIIDKRWEDHRDPSHCWRFAKPPPILNVADASRDCEVVSKSFQMWSIVDWLLFTPSLPIQRGLILNIRCQILVKVIHMMRGRETLPITIARLCSLMVLSKLTQCTTMKFCLINNEVLGPL